MRRHPSWIPVAHRSFLALATWTLPALASAQAWSESDVIARAEEASPDARAALIQSRIAEARAQTAGLFPNPRVEWERQETFPPYPNGQDLVRLVAPLEVGGRLPARRALAEVDAALSAAQAARIESDAVEAALVAFYRALALERRAALRREAVAALDEAQRVILARRAAGEAAGYDAARLTLESELARSQAQEADVEAAAARGALGSLLGTRAPHELAGDLPPQAPPSLAHLLDVALDRREDVPALRRAESAAARARAAADWAWIPEIALTGGYNRQFFENLQGNGYVFVVSIPLPIFDYGQAEREQARAADEAVGAYREALEARIEAEVSTAHQRVVALIAERARFEEAVRAPLDVVTRAAVSGYAEGERSVLELVDARRAAVDAADRALALELAARLAEVHLRRVSGGLR